MTLFFLSGEQVPAPLGAGLPTPPKRPTAGLLFGLAESPDVFSSLDGCRSRVVYDYDP